MEGNVLILLSSWQLVWKCNRARLRLMMMSKRARRVRYLSLHCVRGAITKTSTVAGILIWEATICALELRERSREIDAMMAVPAILLAWSVRDTGGVEVATRLWRVCVFGWLRRKRARMRSFILRSPNCRIARVQEFWIVNFCIHWVVVGNYIIGS